MIVEQSFFCALSDVVDGSSEEVGLGLESIESVVGDTILEWSFCMLLYFIGYKIL